METLPIIGEAPWLQKKMPRLSASLSKAHHLAPFLAIAGLLLSMLHQSSLGATYGVLKSRPLWYSPSLSVLFMISAIVGGISLTILASMLAARLSENASVDDRLLEKLSHFIGWSLVVYLYFRFWYAFSMTYTYEPGRTEGLRLLTKGPLAINFWFGEIIFGALLPMILLLKKSWRTRPGIRMVALALIVGGLVAYRWDVNLSGQMVVLTYLSNHLQTLYTIYHPATIEVIVAGGIVAFGLMSFTIGVKFFRVVTPTLPEPVNDVVTEPAFAPTD